MANYGLQRASAGIRYEGYTGEWQTCTSVQTNIGSKDETYIFRCPIHEDCCDRECCIREWPPWLIILIVALLFLLLLGACSLLWWCLWRDWKRRPLPQKPSPKVSTLTRRVQTDPEPEAKPGRQIEYYPLVIEKTAPPVDSHDVRIQTDPPFEPDEMDEIEVPYVEPHRLEYHGSELSEERQPLFSRADKPREHTAEIMHLRPGHDQVAAY